MSTRLLNLFKNLMICFFTHPLRTGKLILRCIYRVIKRPRLHTIRDQAYKLDIDVARLRFHSSSKPGQVTVGAEPIVYILTSFYPSEEDIYKRMFIHSRVKEYKRKGMNVSIIVPTTDKQPRKKYVYEGVEVIVESAANLSKIIEVNKPSALCIHIPYRNLVQIIEASTYKCPVYIWVHGAEAERWKRRSFNYSPEEMNEISEKMEKRDQIRMSFNAKIFSDSRYHFIFVSNWMKRISEEDSGVEVVNSTMVPNYINTDLFKFKEKTDESRLKFLSIRPYACRKYANDLSVKAVLELSKKEYFDELSFSFYGDGPLFESTLEPLKQFQNVKIHRTFLSQDEIKKLHDEHGVFLCPTRHDAQGVSLCEAISSGLVAVTNGVTAIPEFFDDSSTLLCEGEGYVEMANKIDEIYNDVRLFQSISKVGSETVRKLFSIEATLQKEIQLISTGVVHDIKKPAVEKVSDLAVGIISDDFTYHSYKPEADFTALSTKSYKSYFRDTLPDMFFCESAWEGIKKFKSCWKNKIGPVPSSEILWILNTCRLNNIPTVFWNKEDPVHFDRFIEVARRFDYVFTSDESYIPKYKEAGCKNVYVLPFAVQPKLFNPVANSSREEGYTFAGSYYNNKPHRCSEMDFVFDQIIQSQKKLIINDRNYEKHTQVFAFPKKYEQYIFPSIPTEKMPMAYKATTVGININTVKKSPTMFARRVFELMGSNTYVLSNPSVGMESMFEGLLSIFRTNEPLELPSEEVMTERRFRALQEVLTKHTYTDRFQFIIDKVFPSMTFSKLKLAVVGKASNLEVSGLKSAAPNFYDFTFFDSEEEISDDCTHKVSVETLTVGAAEFLNEAMLSYRFLDTSTAVVKDLSQVEYTFLEKGLEAGEAAVLPVSSSVSKVFNVSHRGLA